MDSHDLGVQVAFRLRTWRGLTLVGHCVTSDLKADTAERDAPALEGLPRRNRHLQVPLKFELDLVKVAPARVHAPERAIKTPCRCLQRVQMLLLKWSACLF